LEFLGKSAFGIPMNDLSAFGGDERVDEK
jgi:hypothetical protein